MTIEVAEGIVEEMSEDRATIVIQVQHADDPRLAARALAAALDDIARYPGDVYGNAPQIVGGVTNAATGPFIWLDCSWQPDETLEAIPATVAERLREAGVADALIVSPARGGPIGDSLGLARYSPAVVLYLYASPPARPGGRLPELPPAWLDVASQWVTTNAAGAELLWARTSIVEFPLPVADARELFTETVRTGGTTTLVTLSPTSGPVAQVWRPEWTPQDIIERHRQALGTRVATASVNAQLHPSVSLAAGGPGFGDEELLAAYRRLVELARPLAPSAAYGFVSFEPDLGRLGFDVLTEWSTLGGLPAMQLGGVCDTYVFDAYPWQVLGPGHLERLGGPPPSSELIGAGRVEVTIGWPEDWLLDHAEVSPWMPPHRDLSERRRQPGVPQLGRRLLSACLETPTPRTNQT